MIAPASPERARELFGSWEETPIDSCLNGIMGKLLAAEDGESVLAEVGCFRLLAGTPNAELVYYPLPGSFAILVPQNEDWARLIERCYPRNARRVKRYAIRKDTVFDRLYLEKLAAGAPEEYTFSFIDEKLYSECLENSWSEDFVSSYGSKEMFLKKGLGVVALRDGIPVAGASSYSTFSGGIEIEVDTRQDHRRRGLATACAARLILACLEKDLYPSWDAQNIWSVGLAEKLGYRFSHAYTAFEVTKEENKQKP